MPTAAEIFRIAIARGNALHTQALEDMQQRSAEVHEQLSQTMQQRISALSMPKFAFVKRAAQLDEDFWAGVVDSAEQILRNHGELPDSEPAA